MVRRLGELEARVMTVLWSASAPVSVRGVREELNRGGRELAYTTVMTVMDNLHKKGWVQRQLDGRAYLYSATATREQYTAMQMAEAMSGSEDRAAAFAHFVDQIDAASLSALRAAVRHKRGS